MHDIVPGMPYRQRYHVRASYMYTLDAPCYFWWGINLGKTCLLQYFRTYLGASCNIMSSTAGRVPYLVGTQSLEQQVARVRFSAGAKVGPQYPL